MEVDGARMRLDDVVAVARRGEPVGLAPGVLERVAASHAFAADVAARRPIYGRSTGVGANRDAVVDDPEEQALALLRSHATSSGPLRSAERVRAMLVVRLNQLAADGNGVSPDVALGLARLIAADALPPVREGGSIGTADLAALATTALVLAGEVATEPAMPAPTTTFHAGDALGFMSSNAAVLGDAALAVVDLDRLARVVPVLAAMGFAAVQGNPEAFSAAAQVASPFTGARWVCHAVNALVEDLPPARIQDPFGLRTLPQVHGALMDELDRNGSVVRSMLNTAAENPMVSAAHGVAHHGAFHAAYLVQALDALVLSVAQSAQLSLARITMLAEPAYTGLHAFLGYGTPAASGTMIVEYSAASALAELRALATPAGLQVVSLSRGVEEDASFATLAASQALGAVERYRAVLAAELVTALRCLRMKGVRPAPLEPALAQLDAADGGATDAASFGDRDLTNDLLLAEELVDRLPDALPEVTGVPTGASAYDGEEAPS